MKNPVQWYFFVQILKRQDSELNTEPDLKSNTYADKGHNKRYSMRIVA